MLAEAYLGKVAAKAKTETVDDMLSTAVKIARRRGPAPEEIRNIVEEAGRIVRNGNGR